MPKTSISVSQLFGKWVHSHEEDTETAKVFRPGGAPLPPSRGRIAFDLRSDATCDYQSLARDDRHESSGGHWRFDATTGTLSVTLPDGSNQDFLVLSANKDKLVLQQPR